MQGNCGSSNVVQHGSLPAKAWPGVRAELPGWATFPRFDNVFANISTSHAALFVEPPAVDRHGTLRFQVQPLSAIVCYRTCVSLDFTWYDAAGASGTTRSVLNVHRDPCGAESSCRSVYFEGQLRCEVGTEWASVFSQFDEQLTWGNGRGIAFLGGATTTPTVKFEAYNGGEASDEPLMHNPSWLAPVAGGQGRKAFGGMSFLPPALTAHEALSRRAWVGRHEYHVAWLAVQDSGYVHLPCTKDRRLQGWCTGKGGSELDSYRAVSKHFTNGLMPNGDVSNASLRNMCSSSHHRAISTQLYVRRPAFLAFGAFAFFLQFYGGAGGGMSSRAKSKEDHYVDVGTWGLQNVSGRGVPKNVVEQLFHSLTWRKCNEIRTSLLSRRPWIPRVM